MRETTIDFTADDLAEISGCVFAMAVAEQERSGRDGRGLVALYMQTADQLAAQWIALNDGREAPPVKLPPNALSDVAQAALEEALRRLDEMQAHQHEHLPDDAPWRFIIGLLRGQVGAELAMRGAKTN